MILKDIVQEGNNLCFDIGANVGNKTSTFLDLGYKKIICVEPQQSCLDSLKKNFANNERVIIVGVGLSNQKGKKVFHIANESTLSTVDEDFILKVKNERFKTYKWINQVEIDVTTLDHLIDMYGVPDFIKIDVEGHELQVLSGLSKPVKNISFEYTPELHDNFLKCIGIIESISEYKYNFSINETQQYSLEEWVDKDKLDLYLRHNILQKRDANNNLFFGDVYAKLIKK